jgi:uncharacterized membrane protein (UPF0127 family)
MRKLFIIFICSVFLVGCKNSISENYIKIGNQKFIVEVAEDSETRAQGLMFREKLEVNHGMLFVFEQEKFHRFWMKNTSIPLDIVWISSDRKVVDVQTVAPCKTPTCPSYVPQGMAKYVLEINAKSFQGQVGDEAVFDLIERDL